jgi:hypothetical protein
MTGQSPPSEAFQALNADSSSSGVQVNQRDHCASWP